MRSHRSLSLVIAVGVIACALTESAAQKKIGDSPPDEGSCPPPPDCTYVTRASDSYPQPSNRTAGLYWSRPCAEGGSDLSGSWCSEDQWQCVEEVEEPNLGGGSGMMLEHWWEFRDIPAGEQHLVFEGHKSAMANDNFIFFVNTNGPSHRNRMLSDPLDAATFIDTFSDETGSIPILTTSAVSNLYILVQGDQITSSDQQRDRVYIDRLVICTR
jgi:hypothetical protein